MRDRRFRDRLPPELKEDVEKYLKNPSCKCNSPLYDKIAISCKSQIQEYFPNKKFVEEEIDVRPQGIWTVINCHISELESRLKKLPPGDKKIAIARWQDQVTVVVEEG